MLIERADSGLSSASFEAMYCSTVSNVIRSSAYSPKYGRRFRSRRHL